MDILNQRILLNYLFFRLSSLCLREEKFCVDWNTGLPYYSGLYWMWFTEHQVFLWLFITYSFIIDSFLLLSTHCMLLIWNKKESPNKLWFDLLIFLNIVLFCFILCFCHSTHPFFLRWVNLFGGPFFHYHITIHSTFTALNCFLLENRILLNIASPRLLGERAHCNAFKLLYFFTEWRRISHTP